MKNMKIAINTIYSSYSHDRLFCESSCNIGENLLLPTIMLKQRLESMGHEVHTMDMYDPREIDIAFFQEVPAGSLLAVKSVADLGKYILKGRWKNDIFLRTVRAVPKNQRKLLILEPAVVAPKSYDKTLHRLFDKILTWDDTLVEMPSYHKIFCPQYVPAEKYYVPYAEKKEFVIIAGNKTSKHSKEMYSERKRVIRFFEDKCDKFDLYGFGWEKENYKNYKGSVSRKLQTLSQYKYCVCFENMKDISGYITEKIFDCFFAGCVPIYWGADNILDYIPEGTFIDMRKFSSIEDMYDFVSCISEEEYESYLENIRVYLNSEQFHQCFSVERYIDTIIESIL